MSSDFHCRFEPGVDPIQMAKKLAHLCTAKRGASLDQDLLYFDALSAAGWTGICSQSDYRSTFEGFSFHWIASVIKDHLADTKFKQRRVDVIGLGCGDGIKEAELLRSLLDISKEFELTCHLVDKSSPLLITAHRNLTNTFKEGKNVLVREYLADIMHLSNLVTLFDGEDSQNVLRVGTMFGGTLGNLDNELRFIKDSLRSFKSGDLVIVDVVLGFAPYTDSDAIWSEDPRLAFSGTYQEATENWLLGTLNRYRSFSGNTMIENRLHTNPSTSPIQKTYTVELHAVTEQGHERADFNMLRLHRYDQEEFIAAFVKQGFRRLAGKTYGINNKKLIYVFIKE